MYTIHDFLQENRYRISGYSIPCVDDYYHVEDACILGDTVVVAYSDGPSRVSLVRLREVSIRPKYFAYQWSILTTRAEPTPKHEPPPLSSQSEPE